MTALNTSTRRVATAVALAAGATLALSACGAGQITQTSDQVAAINGTSTDAGTIALRNVHIIYPDSEEYSIEPGGTACWASPSRISTATGTMSSPASRPNSPVR